MSYFLYVDESGDPGRNGSDFLILAGAALFTGKWAALNVQLNQLIAHYFPGPIIPTEIHLAELRKGKGAYRAITPENRGKLLDDICRITTDLLSTELTLFAVIADKKSWFRTNPGKTGDDLYAQMFEDISSRFDLYLRRRAAEGFPNKGIIIADPHKASLCESLKNQQRLFHKSGHRWNNVYHLIETVFFLASHESPGLQLADLERVFKLPD